MFPAVAFLLGLLVGWRRAARRGGDRLDRLQYAVVHGIFFALVAVAGAIAAARFGLI